MAALNRRLFQNIFVPFLIFRHEALLLIRNRKLRAIDETYFCQFFEPGNLLSVDICVITGQMSRAVLQLISVDHFWEPSRSESPTQKFRSQTGRWRDNDLNGTRWRNKNFKKRFFEFRDEVCSMSGLKILGTRQTNSTRKLTFWQYQVSFASTTKMSGKIFLRTRSEIDFGKVGHFFAHFISPEQRNLFVFAEFYSNRCHSLSI